MSLAGGNAVAAAQYDAEEPDVVAAKPVDAALSGLVRPVRPAALPLPLFDRVVEGWPAAFPAALGKASGRRWRVTLGPSRTERLAEHVESLDETALLGVVNASTATDAAIVGVDRHTVFMLIEAVLGGAGKEPSEAALKRKLTLIELSLTQPAVMHALAALTGALAPAGALTFAFARWESDRAALDLPQEGGGALILPLTLTCRGRSAGMTVALPLSVLEPLIPALARAYPGEALGSDATWRRHLAREIGQSRAGLMAVLHETMMPLSAVRAFAVGETVTFDVETDPLIAVRSGGVTVATGRLGRANGHVAVRFETRAMTQGGAQP